MVAAAPNALLRDAEDTYVKQLVTTFSLSTRQHALRTFAPTLQCRTRCARRRA